MPFQAEGGGTQLGRSNKVSQVGMTAATPLQATATDLALQAKARCPSGLGNSLSLTDLGRDDAALL